MSSIKAKYRGETLIMCYAILLKWLLKYLQVEVDDPTLIYCDKLGSIQLTKNLVFHTHTKHIEVHYHFMHEVELTYVRTDW